MTILLFQSETEVPSLTSLDEVRQYLNVTDVDTGQGAVLSGLIVQASRAIMRYAEREFSPPSSNVTRVFSYDGGPRIDLAPYDVRAVRSVTLDSDLDVGQQTVLAAGDWRLRPLPAPDGVFQAIDLYCHAWQPGYGMWRHRYGPRDREVTIVGDWGWPYVPADVERACVMTVKVWYERDVAGFSRTYGPDETLLARPLPLPNAATELLAPYRTPVIA